tara:strand:- start:64 stop:396 length:333 start_codon:yes stop_codon:yes gene_type:complete
MLICVSDDRAFNPRNLANLRSPIGALDPSSRVASRGTAWTGLSMSPSVSKCASTDFSVGGGFLAAAFFGMDTGVVPTARYPARWPARLGDGSALLGDGMCVCVHARVRAV